jgi:hypothetical protein
MKEKLTNIGRALTRQEQQTIYGGYAITYWEENTECQNGTKVWMNEDEPTSDEWLDYITEPC